MYMEDPFLKEYVIEEITREIESKGFIIEKVYVENFVENYIESYERLPKKNEIDLIVRSYIQMIRTETPFIDVDEEPDNGNPTANAIEPVVKSFIKKKTLIDSINYNKTQYHSGKVLTIPKPEGTRRLCPICDNENWFKIHESIDKDDIISHFPRIYGKKYTCSGCGCVWKEK